MDVVVVKCPVYMLSGFHTLSTDPKETSSVKKLREVPKQTSPMVTHVEAYSSSFRSMLALAALQLVDLQPARLGYDQVQNRADKVRP